MFNSGDDVNERLRALGDRLATATSATFDLLVCGGSALLFHGLSKRATKDVDVLALIRQNAAGAIMPVTAKPLPPAIAATAEIVARDFSLASSWINPGPTSILDFGLPEGMLERAAMKRYGPALTVRFISRLDLIYLKLDAASEGPGKHFDDLKTLNPTAGELRQAAKWCVSNVDRSEGYRALLKNLLEALGHPDVARGI